MHVKTFIVCIFAVVPRGCRTQARNAHKSARMSRRCLKKIRVGPTYRTAEGRSGVRIAASRFGVTANEIQLETYSAGGIVNDHYRPTGEGAVVGLRFRFCRFYKKRSIETDKFDKDKFLRPPVSRIAYKLTLTPFNAYLLRSVDVLKLFEIAAITYSFFFANTRSVLVVLRRASQIGLRYLYYRVLC